MNGILEPFKINKSMEFIVDIFTGMLIKTGEIAHVPMADRFRQVGEMFNNGMNQIADALDNGDINEQELEFGMQQGIENCMNNLTSQSDEITR